MNADPYFIADGATVRDALMLLISKKTGGVRSAVRVGEAREGVATRCATIA